MRVGDDPLDPAVTQVYDAVRHAGDGRVQQVEVNAHKLSPSELSW